MDKLYKDNWVYNSLPFNIFLLTHNFSYLQQTVVQKFCIKTLKK